MTHVHLIGIGGTGLSAIARVLLESGYSVSGSDRQLSPLAQALQAAGARVFAGHRAENIAGAELVVRSSAVPDDNPEVIAAREAGLPVLKRADFLGRLMDGYIGIGVAGTHGKTTTTAMLAWILVELEQDPTFIIGGVSQNLGVNARSGSGKIFLIEADEYDRMFLGLNPQVAVVTNIEHDHPDCFPTAESFFEAFRDFAGRVLPGGLLIGCDEDPGASRLLAEAARAGIQTRSYGSDARPAGSPTRAYTARALSPNAKGGYSFIFTAQIKSGQNGARQEEKPVLEVPVNLQVPGRHNVLNAAAALAVIDRLGLPLDRAARALGEFTGVGRRFQIVGEAQGVTLIDDYAHHPTEVRATLEAARVRYPERRIWAVWQPHTYTRTLNLLEQFAAAFEAVDRVVVTGIYAAREVPPDGMTPEVVGERAAAAIRVPQALFIQDLEQAAGYLLGELKPGDVVLVLSAGDANTISRMIHETLSNGEQGQPEKPGRTAEERQG